MKSFLNPFHLSKNNIIRFYIYQSEINPSNNRFLVLPEYIILNKHCVILLKESIYLSHILDRKMSEVRHFLQNPLVTLHDIQRAYYSILV